MDVLSPAQRHKNMSHIRSIDSKPEEIVRKYLFSRGFRYRKNDKRFPGKPDIVLPKYNKIVFVNGCFWHQHANCKYASKPKTNTAFWEEKLQKNAARDQSEYALLARMGWDIIVVWECELATKEKAQTRLEQLEREIISR